jgi:hypothetical protein
MVNRAAADTHTLTVVTLVPADLVFGHLKQLDRAAPGRTVFCSSKSCLKGLETSTQNVGQDGVAFCELRFKNFTPVTPLSGATRHFAVARNGMIL